MIRLPVVYRGVALMPMKASRARKFIATKRAKMVFDRKINLRYLKLLVEPSGFTTQEITLGIDPGSTFDGNSAVSKLCHHLNIEFVQRPKKAKGGKKNHPNSVSAFKANQAMNRRIRRGRLRHRKIRFDNRTSMKLAPTIQANLDSRKWLITKLSKYLPITLIRIEDVKFNHYRDLVGKNRLSGVARGASFSNVEVGKSTLYNWIIDTGYTLELIEGHETSKLRSAYLNGKDVKSKDKSEKSFEAHCLDSFIIASRNYDTNLIELNRDTLFLEKIIKQRRQLTRTRKLYKGKWQYFRYAKGGVQVPFTNTSRKLQKVRIKPEGEHSNHPKKWEYLTLGYAEKAKCNTARYGGTSYEGNRCKFFKDNEWHNRTKEFVKG